MVATTSALVSRAVAGPTSSGDRFISDQDSPSSSLQARRAGGMLFSVRLSHWMVRICASSRMALMRPCHPLISRPVSGSVTSGLTTTLSPMVQFLLFIVLLPTFQYAHTRISCSEVEVLLTLCALTFLLEALPHL